MTGAPLIIAEIAFWLLAISALMVLSIGTIISFMPDVEWNIRIRFGWWLGLMLYFLFVFLAPDYFQLLPEKQYPKEVDWSKVFQGIFTQEHWPPWISVPTGFLIAFGLFGLILPLWPESTKMRAFLASLISFLSLFILGYLFFGRDNAAYLAFAFLGFVIGSLAYHSFAGKDLTS